MTKLTTLLLGTLLLTLSGCNHTTVKVADHNQDHCPLEVSADSDLGVFKPIDSRETAATGDQRDTYAHGGHYNFNSNTPHGNSVIDTQNKENFVADLKGFKDPNATSENYEYQTNQEDIIARHTFVLAGADRKIGHHVALYESRHQHHAIVMLEFDFTGAGLKPGTVNTKDLQTGKELFENKILKEGQKDIPPLPAGLYYSVQVSPLNPEFELVTIPTGVTKTFLGSLSTIDSNAKVTRFNPKGSDVIVRVTGLYHFSRLYVKEANDGLQYLSFSAKDADKKQRVVLAHLVKGSLTGIGKNGELNFEQMLEADIVEPKEIDLPNGSLLKIENMAENMPLKSGQKVDALVTVPPNIEYSGPQKIKLAVGKDAYFRLLGIDGSQDAIRKKVRGK